MVPRSQAEEETTVEEMMKFTRRSLFGLLGGAAAAKLIPFTPQEVEAVQEAVKAVEPTFDCFETLKCRQGPFKAGDVVRNCETNETFFVRHAEAARVTARRDGPMFPKGELYGDVPGKRWPFHKLITKPEEKGWKTFEYHGGKYRSALVIVPLTALGVGDSVTFTATPLAEYEGYDDLWFVGAAYEQGQTAP